MKVLGIGISGVIRDFNTQFDKYYRRAFIHNEALVGMDENFRAVEKEVTEEDAHGFKQLVDQRISLPVDSYDLLNHYDFDDDDAFDRFLHEEYAFQLFGAAQEFERASEFVNNIQGYGLENGLYETMLFSKEKTISVGATYYFLSKISCRARNIKFINEDSQIWDYVDAVITDCPEIIENKPEDKTAIKINHLYNEYALSDYSFDNIKDVYNQKFLSEVFVDIKKNKKS